MDERLDSPSRSDLIAGIAGQMVSGWVTEAAAGAKPKPAAASPASGELTWMLEELLGMRGKLEALSDAASRTASEKRALTTERDRLSAEVGGLRDELAIVRDQLQEMARARQKLDALESVSLEEKRALDAAREKLKRLESGAAEEKRALAAERDQLLAELKRIRGELDAVRPQLGSLKEARLKLAALESVVSQRRTLSDDRDRTLHGELDAVRKQLKALDETRGKLDTLEAGSAAEKRALAAQKDQLLAELKQLHRELDTVRPQLGSLAEARLKLAALESVVSQRRALSDDRDRALHGELDAVRKQLKALDETRSKLDSLEAGPAPEPSSPRPTPEKTKPKPAPPAPRAPRQGLGFGRMRRSLSAPTGDEFDLMKEFCRDRDSGS